jgi:hypothetical protein
MQTLDRQSLENIVKRLTVRSGRTLRTVMSTNAALRPSTQPTLKMQKEAVVVRVKAFVDALAQHVLTVRAIGNNVTSNNAVSNNVVCNDVIVLRFPDQNVTLRIHNGTIQMQVWTMDIASMKPATYVAPGNLLKKLKERKDLHLCESITVRSYTSLARNVNNSPDSSEVQFIEAWHTEGEHVPARLSTDATFKAYLASLRALQKACKDWVKLTARA